jgi:hypothetical protein
MFHFKNTASGIHLLYLFQYTQKTNTEIIILTFAAVTSPDQQMNNQEAFFF